jgi:hypothetical protein
MTASPYSPIGPDDFRLLKVEKIHPKVEFALEIFPVDDAPHYEALSYAWGTLPASEECICNGDGFYVSPTLYRALQRIYRDRELGWLWIDAICINQKDETEKASQVAQMGDVYTYADQVVVWLGEAEDESNMALERMPSLADSFWAIKDHGWGYRNIDEIVSLGLPHPSDPVWLAAIMVFGRPWFQRLWIVQEIVLARHSIFVCGERQVEWAYAVNFAQAMAMSAFGAQIAGLYTRQMGPEQTEHCINGLRLLRNTYKLRLAWETENEEGLIRMVIKIMQSQSASEPVDYVYAVLGMIPENISQSISVDYSAESRLNYRKAHAHMFKLLLQKISDWPSSLFPTNVEGGDLPSWCPIWGSGFNASFLPSVGTGAGRSASEQARSPSKPFSVAANEDPSVIDVAGAVVDIIKHIVRLEEWNGDNYGIAIGAGTMLESIKRCLFYVPVDSENYRRLVGVFIGDHNWHQSSTFRDYPNEDFLADFLKYLERIAATKGRESEPIILDLDSSSEWLGENRFVRSYLNSLFFRWTGRCFAITNNGRIGLVPDQSKPGDPVCIFFGAKPPYIICRSETSSHCKLRGPCFIDGIMDGELFEDGRLEEQEEIFHIK